jgi:acyl carrier protein
MLFKYFKKGDKNNSTHNGSFELVKDLVSKILADDLGDIELTPETKLEDIGYDSIKFINLLLSLEDIINVDLENIAAEIDPASIRKISDIVELVEKFKK